jgi:hypothetical protein
VHRAARHLHPGLQRITQPTFIVFHAKDDPILTQIVAAIAKSIDAAPQVRRMPVNARIQRPRLGYHGVFTYTTGDIRKLKIKLSLLTVQELLAGRLPYETFRQDFDGAAHAIANAHQRGLAISSLRIEPCPDDDDDWLHIEFDAVQPNHLFDTMPADKRTES